MLSRRLVLLALAALVAGVGAAAAGVFLVGADEGRASETGGSETGEPLSGPEVRFGGADVTTGAAVGLGKLKGRPVVVTVWASWCKACPAQAEPLRRFAAVVHQAGVTEDEPDLRIVEQPELACQTIGMPDVVRVDERDELASRLAKGQVAGGVGAAVR